MATLTRAVTMFVYLVVGVAFLAADGATLLANRGVLPDAVQDTLNQFSQDNLGMLHILQEFGSTLILVGLLTFWFLWHYGQSRGFHWAMTVYWALIALVHWFHIAGPPESFVGPLVTTVPFVVFALLGLMRMATEDRTRTMV